jgi:hypothetical protein
MLGPVATSQYPTSAWSSVPKEVDFCEIWKVCGSTVEKHIDKHPQWKVYCVLYFEGLMHGAELTQKRLAKPVKAVDKSTWRD